MYSRVLRVRCVSLIRATSIRLLCRSKSSSVLRCRSPFILISSTDNEPTVSRLVWAIDVCVGVYNIGQLLCEADEGLDEDTNATYKKA